MLRRKAKRNIESIETEKTEAAKKKKAIVEEDPNAESHFEKLLFGEATSSLDVFKPDKDDEDDYSEDSDEVGVF